MDEDYTKRHKELMDMEKKQLVEICKERDIPIGCAYNKNQIAGAIAGSERFGRVWEAIIRG